MRALTKKLRELQAEVERRALGRPEPKIMLTYEGESVPSGWLAINLGPRMSDEEGHYDVECNVLRGQLEIVGGPEDMSVSAVTARWRSASWPLPGEDGFRPSELDLYGERLAASIRGDASLG